MQFLERRDAISKDRPLFGLVFVGGEVFVGDFNFSVDMGKGSNYGKGEVHGPNRYIVKVSTG